MMHKVAVLCALVALVMVLGQIPPGEPETSVIQVGEVQDVVLAPIVTVYDHAAVRLWYLESRCGMDKSYLDPQPAGEEGQWQVTPDTRETFRKVFGYEMRIHDPLAMIETDVPNYLWWFGHERRERLGEAITVESLVALWQKGPWHD